MPQGKHQWARRRKHVEARCHWDWAFRIVFYSGSATRRGDPGPDTSIPLYPAAPALLSFLACAGDVVALPDERAFEVAMIASCFSTWTYDLAGAVAVELSRHGLDIATARELTLGNIVGAAGFALTKPHQPLAVISSEIATEGTFTKMGLDHLKGRSFEVPWREAIAMIGAKLRETG